MKKIKWKNKYGYKYRSHRFRPALHRTHSCDRVSQLTLFIRGVKDWERERESEQQTRINGVENMVSRYLINKQIKNPENVLGIFYFLPLMRLQSQGRDIFQFFFLKNC